jgi:type I restriction enzyme R subunit
LTFEDNGMTKSEAQTRIELIDKQLGQSGWNVSDPMHVVHEYDILVGLPEGIEEPQTPYQGHQFSD